MKVGIITIVDNDNYGNRLQNYAVQKVLKNLNVDSETINYEVSLNKNMNSIIYLLKLLKRKIGKLKRYIKNNNKKLELSKKRKNNFIKFGENIKIKNRPLLLINKKINNKYDYFLVGSDQIWNPNFGRIGDVEFLTFADKNKRIAYVPSFGVENIAEQYNHFCGEALKNFKAVSVREEAGKKIVKNLTDREDIEVLVDPTMTLSKEEWIQLAKRPDCLKTDNFIFCYFLGNISNERMRYIEKITNYEDIKIINILDKNSEFYAMGPSEFIYLINNAKLICTDSFHACIFSILLRKEFIIFDRDDKLESMNSRIDTLLNKFNLESRKYENIQKGLNKIDYSGTEDILEIERQKSYDFLKKAMGIK